jgi:anti-sigma factor RsiW
MKITGDCALFFEQMSEYIDGSLSGTDRLKLEDHLKKCPSCLHYADSLKALRECLRNNCKDCAGVSKLVDDCVKKFLSTKVNE